MLKVKIKKKKKSKDKPKKFTGSGLRIIDDDLFASGFKPVEESTDEDAEELPQIAEVVDERPMEVQVLESFNQSKWKRLESDESRKEKVKETLDLSPPRLNRRSEPQLNKDFSPPRRRAESPRGQRRKNSDDFSPPRKRVAGKSPPRRRNQEDFRNRSSSENSDFSPPRRRVAEEKSPPRRGHQEDFRSRNSSKNSVDSSPPRRRVADKSPPRRRLESPRVQRRKDSDDFSPPRKRVAGKSPPRRGHQEDFRNRSSSSSHSKYGERSGRPGASGVAEIIDTSESDKKSKTTLDGKKAGLQKAKALHDEMIEFKKRENEMFQALSDEVSGRNAVAVRRDRRTEEDLAKEAEKERKEAERREQYDKWGKGLKQVEEQESRVRSALHEISKPLARYKDDEDLDAHLKLQDRDGDPMLEYLAAKRRKATGGVEKPRYSGPQPPPNRFKILPGYRWDGVDRSNGYEKEWFARINAKKALEEEAHKWSVEDL